jgi:hypothetical protein
MWYILDILDDIFDLALKHMGGKYFINIIPFYEPGKQKYGCNYFTNISELISYVSFPLLVIRKRIIHRINILKPQVYSK